MKKLEIIGDRICRVECVTLPIVATIWDRAQGGGVQTAVYLGEASTMATVRAWLADNRLTQRGAPWIGATLEIDGKVYHNCVSVPCYEAVIA